MPASPVHPLLAENRARFGPRLAALRLEREWTGEQLAEAGGFHRKTINLIETAGIRPTSTVSSFSPTRSASNHSNSFAGPARDPLDRVDHGAVRDGVCRLVGSATVSAVCRQEVLSLGDLGCRTAGRA